MSSIVFKCFCTACGSEEKRDLSMLYNYIIYDDIISLNIPPKIELNGHKQFLFVLGSVPTFCHNANHGYIKNLSIKRNNPVDELTATNTLHAFQTEANRICTGILC
jgi:hypothetical protein